MSIGVFALTLSVGCFDEDAEKIIIVKPPAGTAPGCAIPQAGGSGGGGSAGDKCPKRYDPNELVVARFKNNLPDHDIDVFWVNRNCVEEVKLTVGPGQIQQVTTFVTHFWIVRDAETQELLKEIEIMDTTPRTYEVP